MTLAPARRSRARGLIGLAVSAVAVAGFLVWALRQEAPDLPTSPGALALVAAAVAVYALATGIRGWRWHAILRRAGIGHATADAYGLTVVGYMGNTVLPARGGEALRILLLGERSEARRREILGSIVAERLLDAATLVVLFAAVTWSGVAGTSTGREAAAAAVAVLAVLAVLAGAYIRLRRRGWAERFAALVRPFVLASRLLLGRAGVEVAVATVCVWLLEGVIFWLVGRALDVDVGLVGAIFLVALTSFFSLIPAAPGYVGTFDAALVFALSALDVGGGDALAFVVLVRFVLFVPITLAGLGLVIARYGGMPRLRGTVPT